MNLKKCVVTINGNLKNKQEAGRIILNELEIFKTMDRENKHYSNRKHSYQY